MVVLVVEEQRGNPKPVMLVRLRVDQKRRVQMRHVMLAQSKGSVPMMVGWRYLVG